MCIKKYNKKLIVNFRNIFAILIHLRGTKCNQVGHDCCLLLNIQQNNIHDCNLMPIGKLD